MGMKGRAPYIAIAVSDTDFWDVGPAVATGTYVKPWYYAEPKSSPAFPPLHQRTWASISPRPITDSLRTSPGSSGTGVEIPQPS